ncbi:unnamed protein product [Camellia sinensis]
MEVGEGKEGWVTATGGESVEEWGCRVRVVQKHILIRNSLNRYDFLWFLSSVFKFGSGATNEVLGCAIMVITTAGARGGGLECGDEPSLAAKEVKGILREKKGIHVTAYSPLGAKGTRWETNLVMDCEILKEIAEAKGKTVAQ